MYGINLELSAPHFGHIFGGAGPSCIYAQTTHCHLSAFCILCTSIISPIRGEGILFPPPIEGGKRAVSYPCLYPRICLRSWSGVVIGAMLKFSTRKFSTLGVMKAGRLGPSLMFLMPRWSSVSRPPPVQRLSGWRSRRRCTGQHPRAWVCRRCRRSPAC